jgi:RNA polymerase sigma-70 factor (ECF subfamily)
MSAELTVLPDEREATPFELEVWSHRCIMLNVARRMLRRYPNGPELAEDLVQDSIFKALRKANQFNQSAKLSTWLLSITRNRVIDFMRAGKGKFFESLETITQPEEGKEASEIQLVSDNTEARFIGNLDWERVEQALLRLPTSVRKTLLLRFEEELSYEEIALTQGIALGTVKSRLHRGVVLLRSILDQGSIEHETIDTTEYEQFMVTEY